MQNVAKYLCSMHYASCYHIILSVLTRIDHGLRLSFILKKQKISLGLKQETNQIQGPN